MGNPTPRRLAASACALALGLALPALALAMDPSTYGPVAPSALCRHPLQPTCLGLYALVAFGYAVVFGSWSMGAVLLLRQQMQPRRWAWALAAAMPLAFALTLLGFEATWWLGVGNDYPLDAGPFFYVNWSVVALVFAAQMAAMTGLIGWARR